MPTFNKSGGHRRSRRKKDRNQSFKKESNVYFVGRVIEVLPQAKCKVKIERNEGLDPLVIECRIPTKFIISNFRIILGDRVEVEVNPENDIDAELGITKGLITTRLAVKI